MSTTLVTARVSGVNSSNLYSVGCGKIGASTVSGVVTTIGVSAVSANPPRNAG